MLPDKVVSMIKQYMDEKIGLEPHIRGVRDLYDRENYTVEIEVHNAQDVVKIYNSNITHDEFFHVDGPRVIMTIHLTKEDVHDVVTSKHI